MAIELGPVAIMEPQTAVSEKTAQRNKANAGSAHKTDKTDQTDKVDKTEKSGKSEKSDKTTESSPSGFMALLAQFDVQMPDPSRPLVAVDAKLPVDKEATEPKTADVTGAVMAGQPPALDPAALLGQMQIGLAGQTGDPNLNSTLPVPTEPLAQSGIAEAASATLAKHIPKASAAAGDSQVQASKPTDLSQIGDASADTKSASVADKHPLAQSLQATVNATMTAAQNAVARADKAVEASGGLNPTATLGESFRQLVDMAKSDKPAEVTTATSHSFAADRTHAAPSGGWDFSTISAKTKPDSPGATPSLTGFAAEAQGANQVSLWVSQNVQSAELKLDAQGTDPVEVSISLSGGEAQVQFRSDIAETRDMLSRAVADLDRSLQREGLVLSGVSVGTSAQGRDNSREPGENDATSRQFGLRAGQRTGGDVPLNALRLSAVQRPSQGAVDLFV